MTENQPNTTTEPKENPIAKRFISRTERIKPNTERIATNAKIITVPIMKPPLLQK